MTKIKLPLLLYALTIFLSAFLLFQVQPIIARIILPWFGGSAAVWTTCLLFFQIVLLLGYLYAHAAIRYLNTFQQRCVHVGLLIISMLALHIMPAANMRPHGTEEPTGRILLLLLLTIGLPYFLLSTTSPLLQAWYDASLRADTTVDPAQRTFPYRLYALSNAGSLLALLSYPALVEPSLTLRQQGQGWSFGYVCFVVLCSIVAWRFRSDISSTTPRREQAIECVDEESFSLETHDNEPTRPPFSSDNSSDNSSDSPAPTKWMYGLWILLAACSSTLLLAISNHLSQNVAAIPFLWVLPLSLYLLSFIWCFGSREWQWHKAFLPLPFAFITVMAFALNHNYQNLNIRILIPLFAAGLFVCCMLCHGELARRKPDTRYLTSFYLMISIGGALGGIFVGLIAPRWFHAEYELPIGLGLCLFIALFALYRKPEQRRWEPSWALLALLTGSLLCYLGANVIELQKRYDVTVRNFYGVLRVSETDKGTDDAMRILTYGTIQHGTQFLKPDRRREHLSYYGTDSGLGKAIQARSDSHPERVGIIGLGTGSIASYGRPGDVYRYYEINPLVKQLAETQFTYLKDCEAKIDVVMGDARLSLEQSLEAGEPQNFDVLAVDAFSSDAIPVHLLTKEAFELYFRNLKPDGILAVHVTNRYLNLAPVTAAIAESLGKEAKIIRTDVDDTKALSATSWVLISGQHSLFKSALLGKICHDIPVPPNTRPWTDDYSNLFQTLKRE